MKSRGYSKEFAAACTSSSASLAIIIPPSIPMILYAAMAQESAVKMFVAGIIPGVIGGLGLDGAVLLLRLEVRFPGRAALRAVPARAGDPRRRLWALILPVVILGGIFGGFVTATEGAALAVVAALFDRRRSSIATSTCKSLYQACVDSAIQTAVVMLLVAASALVGVYPHREPVAADAGQRRSSRITTNPYLVLLLLNVFFLILGMFLHSARRSFSPCRS